MNWDYVLEEGSRLGVLGMLWSGLSLANQLLELPLPKEMAKVGRRLDPLCQEHLVFMSERLSGTGNMGREPADTLVWYLGIRERWRDRIRYSSYLVRSGSLPKKEWARLPHPIFFAILYYSLQPLRLILKYGLPSERLKIGISRWLERMG